ncbi:hypothetical protein N8A98_17590 [Devosia neptuniae]|jgi:hypothetical protein|uniref:Uncharacterized protein n=1 Tax=Devosia neptuniae TaxID=191302 RepID=A0ABY6C9W2_9HYPH|nr:hypothetical protein [Devosia neptuniae]UXN69037.1 hypothetical protein N8A98_17590 [Devosia neptuniae]
MRVLALAAGVALLSAGGMQGSMAQEFSTRDAVVSVCKDVVRMERDEQVSQNGACIGATAQYLSVLQRAPGIDFDQSVADLVVDLTNLLFTPFCRVESEVAVAIRLAGQSARTDAQQAQIRLIYQTVNACDFVVTAAIATPNNDSLFSGGDSDGPRASEN